MLGFRHDFKERTRVNEWRSSSFNGHRFTLQVQVSVSADNESESTTSLEKRIPIAWARLHTNALFGFNTIAS